MKKLLALTIAVIMVLTLAACGGGSENPSGEIADIGGGAAQSGSSQQEASEPAPDEIPSAGQLKVESKSDRVITTADDGLGNTSVTEYIYQNGVLSEIIMTMQCTDVAAAKQLLDSYTSGDLKEYADQLYSDMKQDGKNLICTFNENHSASFANFNIEQLAAVLGGGDLFAGGGSAGETSNGVKINTAWEDLTLPEGFPKLADGVTSFTQMADNIISLDWDVMTLAQAESMLPPIETWAGAKFQAYGDEAYMNWSLDTDALNISLAYFADNAAMVQVTLSISVW